jgi:hypothetical protein
LTDVDDESHSERWSNPKLIHDRARREEAIAHTDLGLTIIYRVLANPGSHALTLGARLAEVPPKHTNRGHQKYNLRLN